MGQKQRREKVSIYYYLHGKKSKLAIRAFELIFQFKRLSFMDIYIPQLILMLNFE